MVFQMMIDPELAMNQRAIAWITGGYKLRAA
jgi:hypothetical protein